MPALLKARGLATLPNFLSEIPEGALLEALNVVIDRDGIIEPRRGFKQWKSFGTGSGSRAKQLLRYRDRILAHNDNRLSFENGTDTLENFKDNTGSSDAVIMETEPGRRIRGVEAANGNFYFTASSGIKKLSASSSSFSSSLGENKVLDAGVVQALDPVLTVDYSSSGWMQPLSRVAYRVVLGLRDANDNLLLGAPSIRSVASNLSSTTCNVKLRVFLPEGLTEDYFVQIYRSNNPFASSIELFQNATFPNDELQQVLEHQVSSQDLELGYVDLLDTTPAEIQEIGAFLYTNQFSGEGIAQANALPPFAKDTAQFKGSLFFANTRTAHTKDFNLISVSGLENLSVLSVTNVGNEVTLVTESPHGLFPGNAAFVTIPNTEKEFEINSVNMLADSIELTEEGLADNDEIRFESTGALPSPLVSNKFYRFRYLTSLTGQVLEEDGSVIDLLTAGTGDLKLFKQKAVNAVYEAKAGTAGSTLVIEIEDETLLSDLENGAKVQPSSFVVAKLDASTEDAYYFGGSSGRFSVRVDSSPISDSPTIEDRYLKVNAFDRERRYYFYISKNDPAPPLDVASFPDVKGRIPVNIVVLDKTLTLTAAVGTTLTVPLHGLQSGDIVTNDTVGGLNPGSSYFVIRLTDNTFQVANSFGGTPIAVSSVGNLFKQSTSAEIAEALSDAFNAYGDWKQATKFELDLNPSQIDTSSDNITIPGHGLSDGDRAYFTSSLTGPNIHPADEIIGDGYYVKVIDDDTLELYVDPTLTNQVDFTSQGTGILTLKTNRLAVENATVGQFGYSSAIASPVNPDVEDGQFDAGPTFTVFIDRLGFGESFNLETRHFLVKRSEFSLVSNQIDETARSLIKLININSFSPVYAYYTSGSQDFTPRITFTAKDLQNINILFGLNDNIGASGATNFEPVLPLSIPTSYVGGDSVTFTSPSHGLNTGDFIVVSSPFDPLFGARQITKIDEDSFSVSVGSVLPSRTGTRYFKVTQATLASENPNRLYFSKFQQPDAVPALNFIDVGSKNEPIERIVPLRDSLIVLKTDGLFRLSGEIAPNFSVSLFDNSNIIIAPDSAAVLNNQVYMVSTQGVTSVTENGTAVVSRLIENRIIPLTLFPNFKFATFGFSYESDRAYILSVPTIADDTFATQSYRYNTFTQAWTRWDKPLLAGLIAGNKAYVSPADLNFIEQERKNFDRLDHSDREFSLTFSDNFYSPEDNSIIIGSTLGLVMGDALVQYQRVTLAEIVNLALKLGNDPLMPTLAREFYLNFKPKAGSNLIVVMNQLVSQLNSDLGESFTAPLSGAFDVFQQEYNALISELNLSFSLQFQNYSNSVGVKPYETTVIQVKPLLGQVIIDDNMPFVVGEVKHEKAIKTDVVYAPISLGDPSIMKQVRETTTLFENTVFKQAQMGYSTDLDASFEFISFTMQGSGAWGLQNYGEQVFGGSGPSYPFRTYLPREKQRGRYWRLRFKHEYARFRYSLLGVSVVASSATERAYRG
jgi:hypothetical protein